MLDLNYQTMLILGHQRKGGINMSIEHFPRWEKNSFENQAKENDVNNIYPPIFLDMATNHAISERATRAKEIKMEMEALRVEVKELKNAKSLEDGIREAKAVYNAEVERLTEENRLRRETRRVKSKTFDHLQKEYNTIIKELLNGMGL